MRHVNHFLHIHPVLFLLLLLVTFLALVSESTPQRWFKFFVGFALIWIALAFCGCSANHVI